MTKKRFSIMNKSENNNIMRKIKHRIKNKEISVSK